MSITPEKRLAHIRHRIAEIVGRTEYTAQKKRFRAIAQLERLLETVVECLPQEQQVVVNEVLSLYGRVW